MLGVLCAEQERIEEAKAALTYAVDSGHEKVAPIAKQQMFKVLIGIRP